MKPLDMELITVSWYITRELVYMMGPGSQLFMVLRIKTT